MAERLTEKTFGCFEYDLANFEHKTAEFNDYDAFFAYSMVVRALGYYEDLGTVEELSELVKAKQDGRLTVLPCKVGERWKDKQGNFYFVVGFHRDQWAGWSVLYIAEDEKKNGDDLNAVNTAYWLHNFTPEEAEAALKEGNDERD